jgi:hypothetical protein
MSRAPPKDRNGRNVTVGSRVRVVSLSQSFLDSLPENERVDVESMIGEVFEVHEIDTYGSPWVGKGWNSGEGEYKGHSVALDSEEMEVADEGDGIQGWKNGS